MASAAPLSIIPVFESGIYQFHNTSGGSSASLNLKVRVDSENGGAFWFDVTDCRVEITARIFDAESKARGCLVEFDHAITNETLNEIVWDHEMSGQPSKVVLERLAQRGLTVFSESLRKGITTRTLFMKYLLMARPDALISIHSKNGWSEHGNHYVLGKSVIPADEQISLVDDRESFLARQKPDLTEWDKLKPLITKQPMWEFATALAFAGPLIAKLKIPQSSLGGFVFYGGSGKGKSYANMCGQAVFGAEPITFSATRTALEDVALMHNDRTLFLDELHQAGSMGRSESSGSAQIGQVIYDLANGTGKLRRVDAKKLEEPKHWRLLWMGTGEISSADYIRPALGESKEGQRIRAADIPADHPRVHNDLGVVDGRIVCGKIQDLAPKCGGAAGRVFLHWLAKQSKAQLKRMRKDFDELYTEYFEPLAETGTQTRLAERAALVAYAGSLAQDLDLMEFDKTFLASPIAVLDAWRETVGNQATNDVQRCAQAMIAWVDLNRGDKLIPISTVNISVETANDGTRTTETAYAASLGGNYRNFQGFIEDDNVYITPTTFKSLCANFGGSPSICRVFNKESILLKNNGSGSNQFQLKEVKETVRNLTTADKIVLTTLGTIRWRKNSKVYAIDLNQLEAFAYPQKPIGDTTNV